MRNEPGAPSAAGFIPLCVPSIRGNEWKYLKDCLDTGWVSSAGSYVDRFERELARRAGTPHAVAAVNGTSALHVALLVAGVEPDDEVLVSTLTFIAPANAVRYANAWPVFIDAEPDFWQMDPARAAEFLRERCERRDGALRNRRTGRRVKAIIPVHILGHPADMDPILALAREFDLAVIEDATESLGARYRERPVGQL
ncbi:MAG TPA: aminotransferase class I/II-fold pyridoxal phosphate-dependent enzyme, partial [Chthoniobacteraceae bacterium]|nr:aminotransferase class I/II-fold pyridoxal phosphate-dependent enzyme [Chthoniobacteraceae bacterium]